MIGVRPVLAPARGTRKPRQPRFSCATGLATLGGARSGWNQYLSATTGCVHRGDSVDYGTEKAALALRVIPPSVHVTVCVPVPAFVRVVVV